MGGGYIECGSFFGEDKSGSAIEGVFEAIAAMLSPEERERWQTDFITALRTMSDDAGFLIEPHLVKMLMVPLEKYYADLGARLGYPNPYEAPGMDAARGLNPTEAKWGAGDGWRYYCAHDLLEACKVSLEDGEDIVISFD